MPTTRSAILPDDAPAIAALDTGFTTDTILSVEHSNRGFVLHPLRLEQSLTKVFPLHDLHNSERPWNFARVAIHEDRIVAFIATGYQPWNKRLILWHLYVDRPYRCQHIGQSLIAEALQHGIKNGAQHVWAETSNLNAPGIAAYERWGFELCGLDMSLYRHTAAEGEVALFLARAI
jgi:ribosomal protein S18 acetylase RimI-like enzyme